MRWGHFLTPVVRQSVIAILAVLLVLAIAAYDDLSSKTTGAKVQLSGTVTQWSTLGLGGHDNSVRFRVGAFPFELGIDAAALALLAKHGVSEPLNVGARVEAVIAKSDVVTARELTESGGGAAGTPIPVLALRVEGKTMFGAPEAFRLKRSMNTWPYLLFLCAAGAMLTFSQRRRRRKSRHI